MKILIAITSLGVGGAEKLVTGLADIFSEKGHDVMLVALTGEIELPPTDPRVNIVALNMMRSPLGVLSAVIRLRKIIKSFRPDVVNSHLVHANIIFRVLRTFTPMLRLISSAHNTNEEHRVRMLAYRITDSLADISTNVSAEAVQAFVKQKAVLPGRMLVMYNGIDLNFFNYRDDAKEWVRKELGLSNKKVIMAIGRLKEQKDYPNLLYAFSKINSYNKEVVLAIAGEGPLRAELNALAYKLGIAEHVYFLGIRHDIPSLLAGCDVFVLSSAWEGFGLVVAEAMACKKVVVATDCGGVKEVLGETGYLVPPRNPIALADALQQALNLNVDQCLKLTHSARLRVESLYSLTTAADKWLRLYGGETVVDSTQNTSTMEVQ